MGVDRLKAWWLRLTCGRDHGIVIVGPNQVWVECARCGYVSPGIVLESQRVRLAWRFDWQRARFRKAS